MALNTAFTADYTSAIVSGFDIWKPEILNKLYRNQGKQGAEWFMMLNALGFEKPVALETYSHYEDTSIHQLLQILTGAGAPGNGVALTFKLHGSCLTADDNTYARVGDQLMFNASRTTATITAVTVIGAGDVEVTCTPDDVGRDIGVTGNNEFVGIISNAHAEGTGQPNGKIKDVIEVSNQTQIIKETITATGTEITNQTWFDTAEDGSKTSAWYNEGLMDGEYRQAASCSGALLFSNKSVFAAGGTNTTGGLIPYAETTAIQKTIAPGAFAITDFDTADAELTKQFAPNYICAYNGITLDQDIENAMVTYLDNANIPYAKKAFNDQLFNGNESLAVSMDFTHMVKSQRTYGFKRMNELSNPNLYNHVDSETNSLGIWIPLSKTKDAEGKLSTFVGARYKSKDGHSRKMETWSYGAGGMGVKIGDIDNDNFYWRSDIGGHQMKGNQMLLIQAS